jgi:hypothetical protein
MYEVACLGARLLRRRDDETGWGREHGCVVDGSDRHEEDGYLRLPKRLSAGEGLRVSNDTDS